MEEGCPTEACPPQQPRSIIFLLAEQHHLHQLAQQHQQISNRISNNSNNSNSYSNSRFLSYSSRWRGSGVKCIWPSKPEKR